MESINIYRKTA